MFQLIFHCFQQNFMDIHKTNEKNIYTYFSHVPDTIHTHLKYVSINFTVSKTFQWMYVNINGFQTCLHLFQSSSIHHSQIFHLFQLCFSHFSHPFEKHSVIFWFISETFNRHYHSFALFYYFLIISNTFHTKKTIMFHTCTKHILQIP